MSVTQWKPDTCGCEFFVDFETRRVSSGTRCASHARTSTLKLFETVHDENVRKNKSRDAVMSVAALVDKKLASDGSGQIVSEFKKGIKFSWSFDDQRQLVIDVQGMPEHARKSVEQAIEKSLGRGMGQLKRVDD